MRGQALCLLISFIDRERIKKMNPQGVDAIDVNGSKCKFALKAIAEIIRRQSESGRLVSPEEIFQDLRNRNFLSEDQVKDDQFLEVVLEKTMEENGDIVKLQTEGGSPYFFSSQFMTESYARILIQRESDPMLLIAEMVRENSAVYPRPVPLSSFQNSPFDWTQEEIQCFLNQMDRRDAFKDIQQTTSSLGTAFLYSTLHLDPGYASMLAEWIDVGQANNP